MAHDADFIAADRWAKRLIPSHLDAAELIANAWGNAADAADATVDEQVQVFKQTVLMYIDQDCSTF